MAVIQTTLGEIDITKLGRVNVHEHVVIDGDQIKKLYPDFIHHDVDILSEELMEWKVAGGGAIIDSSPIDAGRDIAKLEIISRKVNLPIIASTGFHKETYYSQDHWVYSKTSDEISDILLGECTSGIQDRNPDGGLAARSNTRAGVIKLGVDHTGITPLLEKLLHSILELQRDHEIPLMLHTEPDVPFSELIHWFEKNQACPEKTVFCHMDKVTDFNIQQLLASKGFFIEFDSLARQKPGFKALTAVIKKLIDHGMGAQILFAGDLARRSYWKCYGGEPGLAFLIKEAVDQMLGYGLSKNDLDRIWIANPQAWLG